jgi:hypothetical protein
VDGRTSQDKPGHDDVNRAPLGALAGGPGVASFDWPAYVFMAAPSCSSYITGEILPIIGRYSGG